MTQSQQRLWPEPESMHDYLDRWVSVITELDKELARLRKFYAAEATTAQLTIDDLKKRLETQAQPYIEQIDDLKKQVRYAEQHIVDLEQESQSTIERLALVTEVPANARGTTLTSLVGQVILIVEESKKMIQENL